MSDRPANWKPVVVVASLALIHLAVGLMPGSPLGLPTNIVLFFANLFVLACARTVLRTGSPWRVGLFATGYFVLFLLVLVLLERESLFILLIIAYASVFPVPYLLGYFLLFVLSFVVLQPYSFESFLPLCLVYAALWQAVRAGASRFLIGSLAVGLVALTLVLLPLLHLMLEDSPRTLGFVLDRPDVQQALKVSILSSSISTVIVALWGVPLAYALARLPIRGARLLEVMVDLPILVPQSVVGVALLSLLGPGSPLGELLGARFGVQVAGRLAGVVVAQVFVSCPFLIKTAMTAFEGVPPHLESAARVLGASPSATFFRVSLPLASRGVLVGAVLCWARAVSEFGSIILFASTPLTAPVLVHQEFARAGLSESRPIAVLLLVVCLWIFVLLQFGRGLLPMGTRRSREERL
jgi:molybdate/tungstate transport system permease protein